MAIWAGLAAIAVAAICIILGNWALEKILRGQDPLPSPPEAPPLPPPLVDVLQGDTLLRDVLQGQADDMNEAMAQQREVMARHQEEARRMLASARQQLEAHRLTFNSEFRTALVRRTPVATPAKPAPAKPAAAAAEPTQEQKSRFDREDPV